MIAVFSGNVQDLGPRPLHSSAADVLDVDADNAVALWLQLLARCLPQQPDHRGPVVLQLQVASRGHLARASRREAAEQLLPDLRVGAPQAELLPQSVDEAIAPIAARFSDGSRYPGIP